MTVDPSKLNAAAREGYALGLAAAEAELRDLVERARQTVKTYREEEAPDSPYVRYWESRAAAFSYAVGCVMNLPKPKLEPEQEPEPEPTASPAAPTSPVGEVAFIRGVLHQLVEEVIPDPSGNMPLTRTRWRRVPYRHEVP